MVLQSPEMSENFYGGPWLLGLRCIRNKIVFFCSGTCTVGVSMSNLVFLSLMFFGNRGDPSG